MPRGSRKSLKRKKPVHHQNPESQTHNPDFLLLASTVGLTIFGLIMITNVSAYEGFHIFNDKYYFAKQQLISIVIGFIAGAVAYKIDYRIFYKISPYIFLGSIVLLVLVLIPGIGTSALGARRWIYLSQFIPIPGLTLQPAEIVKPAIIMYLAAWITKRSGRFNLKTLLYFGVMALVVIGLVMGEPDLGTTIVIIATAGLLYFLSGAPLTQFILLAPIVIAGFVGLIVFEPYRLRRLTTFFNPDIDPQGISYHISQILITIGSGGFLGVGFGNSGQKYGYLPEATTDSIFAVIAGELGFVGAVVLIIVYVMLILRAFRIAQHTKDHFGRLLALGLTIWFGVQTVVNMGSMVALFPLTGVPLPFISFGGSSLVVSLGAVGILLNISRHTKSS